MSTKLLPMLIAGSALAQQPATELAPLEIIAPESKDGIVVTEDQFSHTPHRTLGEILGKLPGFSNRSFGPSVGQPVIRGQVGPRTKVMRNSLGTNDLSSVSPDHALGLETLSIERIEILRGPATLRYGSGLIGGTINVVDGRIPENLPDHPLELSGGYHYDSPSDGHSGKALVDLGAGPLALHLEGMRRSNGDLQTGRGRLDNTSGEVRSGSVGASWVGAQGFVGAATERLEKDYGIPSADGEKADIELRQTRYDLRARWYPASPHIDALEAGVNINDYRHVEFEDGQRGTLWLRRAVESRLELTHTLFGTGGSLGFQSRYGELSAEGEEAILPPTESEIYALFINQQLSLDAFTFSLGARVEHRRIDAKDFSLRRDLPVSGAIAASWNHGNHHLELSFTTTQRAPNPQELYVHGVHIATKSFEIGDPSLDLEHSHQLEVGYRLERTLLAAEINLFQYWIDNYIFFNNTGEIDPESGYFIFRARQKDAFFRGFEAKLDFTLFDNRFGNLDLMLFSDYTRGRFEAGGDIPRMPPLRYGLALNFEHDGFDLNLRLTRAESQDHPGNNEAFTPGYVLLDLGGKYRFQVGKRTQIVLYAQLINLLDQTVRDSTSFLRTIAPGPGRGFNAGIRLNL